MSNDDKEGLEALKYIGIECECASQFNEVQEVKQAYFIEGYHQAERDLALTWEDMKLIETISLKVDIECDLGEKENYEEVLRRFKARKGQ